MKINNANEHHSIQFEFFFLSSDWTDKMMKKKNITRSKMMKIYINTNGVLQYNIVNTFICLLQVLDISFCYGYVVNSVYRVQNNHKFSTVRGRIK